MALIKTRPKVTVMTPSVVLPGESFVARVELDARRPIPLDWLDVRLVGGISTVHGSGNHQSSRRCSVVAMRARLCDRHELPKGKSELRCRFELPEGLPPSYDGRSASVRYTIDVHASIPWWPDVKQSFLLRVGWSPPARPAAPKPGLYSSDPDGPRGTEPHAEVSVLDTVLPSGGVLAGAIALSNVASSSYTGLAVALVGDELLRTDGSAVSVESARFELRLPASRIEEGASIPIRMRLPAVSPSLETELFRLVWNLEVRAKRRLASALVLRVPLVITAASSDAGSAPIQRAPPTVGSERLARVWDAVAERVGLERVGEELRGRVAEVDLRVFREQRGRRGYYLVAELSFASLHLGLDGGLRTGFRRLFTGKEVLLGDSRWDRMFYLTGTDEGQIRAFAEVMRPALVSARLVDLTDQRLSLEAKSAGLSGDPLLALAARAMDVARRLSQVRLAIPPPHGFELQPWRELAHFVKGTLETARMIVAGELDGHAVRVATEWSDTEALATVLTLTPRLPLHARFAGHFELDGSEVPAFADEDGEPRSLELQPELASSLASLLREAERLAIATDELSLVVPVALRDPETVRPLLLELSRAAELMSARRGAYR